MSVHCKIECVHCKRAAHWDDDAPVFFSHGGSVGGHRVNRTFPEGWVTTPDEPVSGQLSERAKGICPDCRDFTLTFTGDDAPGLWGRSFDVRAVEPGVFDVVQEDATPFGQVRWASRNALLVPRHDAPMDHLGYIAGRIAERFGLA